MKKNLSKKKPIGQNYVQFFTRIKNILCILLTTMSAELLF